MNVRQVLGGEWLSKDDLKPGDNVVRITEVALNEDERDGKTRKQFVLRFKGSDKRFGLNMTNTAILQQLFGDETDDWVNQKVALYIDPTVRNAAGQMVGGVRLRAVSQAVPPRQAAPPPPPREAGDDDDEGNDGPPF